MILIEIKRMTITQNENDFNTIYIVEKLDAKERIFSMKTVTFDICFYIYLLLKKFIERVYK